MEKIAERETDREGKKESYGGRELVYSVVINVGIEFK